MWCHLCDACATSGLSAPTLLWGPAGDEATGARDLGRGAMLPFPALGQGTRDKGQGQSVKSPAPAL